MAKIFINCLVGRGKIGTYELQLGNVAVLIPMLRMLREHVSGAEISTNIQLTEAFCAANGVTVIPDPKRLLLRLDVPLRLMRSFINLFRASLWRFFSRFMHLNLAILIRGETLKRIASLDVALDFNGDSFPSDIHSIFRLLSHTMTILTIRKLGVPVVEFVSSPGPFNTRFQRFISKLIFNKAIVFVNREPVSSELLKQLGIRKVPIVNTACPALLLGPAPEERAKEILSLENIDVKARPLIGVTLCGYNLADRTWGKRISFGGLSLYIPMLEYLLDDLQANIFLLPHVYRSNPYVGFREYINGPDYDILLHLYKMLDGDKYNGRLRMIEGKYTTSEAKSIIGQCDMYISGRLHAGVAALSQAIPTVLLSYGHKNRGFARLFHQEKYVFDGGSPEKLKAMVEDAWKSREEIAETLIDRMPRIRELADLSFKIVGELVDYRTGSRDNIPKEISDTWIKRGEQYEC